MKLLIVLLLVLFLASVWDYRLGKIPNLLLAFGAFYGILRMLYYQNFIQHIPGILLPFLLYPLYKIGTIGAGDLKLFSVIGCYISFMECMYCLFLTFVISAAYALLKMGQKDHLTDRISYLISYIKDCMIQKQIHYYYKDSSGKLLSGEEIKKTKIHMAIPALISVLIHWGGVF